MLSRASEIGDSPGAVVSEFWLGLASGQVAQRARCLGSESLSSSGWPSMNVFFTSAEQLDTRLPTIPGY